MQKRSFFISFLLFVAAICYVGYYLFYIVPSDVKKYQMVEEKRKSESSNKRRGVDGIQTRELTSKEIYSSDLPFRLHTHIEAKHSALHFFSTDGRLHVKENLTDLEGIVEEKIWINELGDQEKVFKKFQAKCGIYDYQKKELKTNAIYLEQQKETTPKPFIFKKKISSIYTAKANQASFTIDASSPWFHADKLEMTLHQTEFSLK
jgi:hypothetical protein